VAPSTFDNRTLKGASTAHSCEMGVLANVPAGVADLRIEQIGLACNRPLVSTAQGTAVLRKFPHSNCCKTVLIPGSCVPYPGLLGGGALGDASTPGTPAGSIAASAHGGTYSHVAVAGGAWGGERGAGGGQPAWRNTHGQDRYSAA